MHTNTNKNTNSKVRILQPNQNNIGDHLSVHTAYTPCYLEFEKIHICIFINI
jgi:hypothetical protein